MANYRLSIPVTPSYLELCRFLQKYMPHWVSDLALLAVQSEGLSSKLCGWARNFVICRIKILNQFGLYQEFYDNLTPEGGQTGFCDNMIM